MNDRSNVLFFIADQHRADWLGCTGHPDVRTPNIGNIAANGVHFEGMHAASTVDTPATIMDRAGAAPCNGMPGASFLPTLECGNARREALFIERDGLGSRIGFFDPAKVCSITSRDWRYGSCLDEDHGEFCSLASDPYETCNLWFDHSSRKTRCRLAERLNNHLTCQLEKIPWLAD